LEAKQAEEKRLYALRKYPTLKQIFDKMKLHNVPHVKKQVLKRIHIILEYLRMPALPDDMEPSLEYALGLMGRADMSLKLIEEIGSILQDFSPFTYIRTYPREAIELREHMRTQYKLADDLVRSIVFHKMKESGLYENNDTTRSGGSIPTPVSNSSGDVEKKESGN
jgi:hypothetical protein